MCFLLLIKSSSTRGKKNNTTIGSPAIGVVVHIAIYLDLLRVPPKKTMDPWENQLSHLQQAQVYHIPPYTLCLSENGVYRYTF